MIEVLGALNELYIFGFHSVELGRVIAFALIPWGRSSFSALGSGTERNNTRRII